MPTRRRTVFKTAYLRLWSVQVRVNEDMFSAIHYILQKGMPLIFISEKSDFLKVTLIINNVHSRTETYMVV
jgi:hypothetical protein